MTVHAFVAGSIARNWRLFSNDYRRIVGGVFEKMPRHSGRQADTAMGSAKSRNIAGVHAIAAVESHEVRHASAVKMSPVGLCVFAYIDVGFHHLASAVDVVAEFTRDMVPVLFDYMITTRRRIET